MLRCRIVVEVTRIIAQPGRVYYNARLRKFLTASNPGPAWTSRNERGRPIWTDLFLYSSVGAAYRAPGPWLRATHTHRSSLITQHSWPPGWGLAGGEEGLGSDLGHLAAGGVGAPAEVGAVA